MLAKSIDIDIYYMQLALKKAKYAFAKRELPIGAVIVSSNNEILSYGYNKVESNFSQSKHAEIVAIESASKKLQDWRLTGCTIYVTLEPCLMCMGLIGLSRISRVVFAAHSKLFGYKTNNILPKLYKNHIKDVTHGVCAQEAIILLKNFFKNKREKGE